VRSREKNLPPQIKAFGADAIPYRTVAWHCARIARIANGWAPTQRGKKTHKIAASAVLGLHAQEPKISARKISFRLRVPRSSVQRYLKRAGAKYIRAQVVPHILTAAQKRVQVERCQVLLTHLRDKMLWPRTVTGDESWVEFESSVPGIRVLPNVPRPTRPAKQLTTRKTLISVFFFHLWVPFCPLSREWADC